jgi:hypothetical protein
LTVGCDAELRTTQDVPIFVHDVESGLPITKALITAAREADYLAWSYTVMSEEDWLDLEHIRQSSVRTDDAGEAVLVIETVMICGGVFPRLYPGCDPTMHDRVTGDDYLVRVETESQSEIIRVRMTPSTSHSGAFFLLSVGAVGNPIAVP